MNAEDKVPALTGLPFWWREATIEEVINVVQKKKSKVKGIEGDDHAANIPSFIHSFPSAY